MSGVWQYLGYFESWVMKIQEVWIFQGKLPAEMYSETGLEEERTECHAPFKLQGRVWGESQKALLVKKGLSKLKKQRM